MKLFALFFLSLLLFRYSQAGNGHVIGNGGSTLKCDDNGQTTYRSYDLVEGELLWGLPPVFSLKETYLEKALDIVKRLSLKNPTRENLYIGWITEFASKVQFLPSGETLDIIPDTTVGVIPENCELTQAIVQIHSSEGVTYIVDTNIWNKLDEDNKAALLVHEIIYREALLPENSHENSVNVRHFNQSLHADILKSMSLRSYIDFVAEHELYRADINGIDIKLYYFDPTDQLKKAIALNYYDKNSVESASLAPSAHFSVKTASISFNCSYEPNHHDYNVQFYTDNRVKSLTLPAGCFGQYADSEKYDNQVLNFRQLEFSPEGDLIHLISQ